jgi:hypothetical protein
MVDDYDSKREELLFEFIEGMDYQERRFFDMFGRRFIEAYPEATIIEVAQQYGGLMDDIADQLLSQGHYGSLGPGCGTFILMSGCEPDDSLRETRVFYSRPFDDEGGDRELMIFGPGSTIVDIIEAKLESEEMFM